MQFILISFVFRVPPSKQAAEYIHESSQRDCSGGGCDHKSMVTGSVALSSLEISSQSTYKLDGSVSVLQSSFPLPSSVTLKCIDWAGYIFIVVVMPPPKSISIIGAGISGLTAAYHATRLFPGTAIHLFEQSDRLGGWIDSQRIDLGSHGSALVESGPRTLRPSGVGGALLLDLIDKLHLEKELLTSSKTSSAARNRYIYHPDNLNRLPSSLLAIPGALLRHKTLRSIPRAIWNDLTTPPQQQQHDEHDESVDSFFRRRFGDRIADDIASAVIHGIYAADSRQLSLRFAFPLLHKLEQRAGSVVRGAFRGVGVDAREKALEEDIRSAISPSLTHAMQNASIFAFKEGIAQLVTWLEGALQHSNVAIHTSTAVDRISRHKDAYTVHTQTGLAVESTHLISSVPLPALGMQGNVSESESYSDSVHHLHRPDVTVVTLVYPRTPLPINGFGYLIPRSTPAASNPHGALGVVIDSDAMPQQDPAPLTKLTVMLGGPHGLRTEDTAQLRQMAVDTVTRQLSAHLHSPIASTVCVQRACIPTYPPGHLSALQSLHHSLLSHHHGRLAVIGSPYTGIAVGDCVRSAWEVVQTLNSTGTATGLERFQNAV
ncbi:hypothetical protein E3P89_00527 [Wallemia ichthyophaga]|uniref:Protoporphyrinogen oxidase n=1 Tax=Wallemia ichthyophaga TaxID=245174 RepID=A0A4T0HNS5_WALIC|nr:hypothetical protein E3P90_00686 [Wallemia ichthyophaga]TIB17820.1 hypothetical protein E3P93_00543 [Wallemia ichthyophaga]TIB25549.1 hypothetical protein E3P89_00527 [Wallemia ichthyophaga]TIB27044.1 hypothetical protein E3P88_00555 [Wallemia ichthyophaga]